LKAYEKNAQFNGDKKKWTIDKVRRRLFKFIVLFHFQDTEFPIPIHQGFIVKGIKGE
jgi:hypothetical protein